MPRQVDIQTLELQAPILPADLALHVERRRRKLLLPEEGAKFGEAGAGKVDCERPTGVGSCELNFAVESGASAAQAGLHAL